MILFAEFPHVKAIAEAQQKQADEAAAKTQEYNEIGIGAPGLNASAVEIASWIETFKGAHMENIAGNGKRFKSTITEEQVKALVERVDLWMKDHKSRSAVPTWATFKTDLYAGFNQTFV